jgi:hypothetical protein
MKYYYGIQVKEKKMIRECIAHEQEEKCIQNGA